MSLCPGRKPAPFFALARPRYSTPGCTAPERPTLFWTLKICASSKRLLRRNCSFVRLRSTTFATAAPRSADIPRVCAQSVTRKLQPRDVADTQRWSRFRLFHDEVTIAGTGGDNASPENFGNDAGWFARAVHAVVGLLIGRQALRVQCAKAELVSKQRAAAHGHAAGQQNI